MNSARMRPLPARCQLADSVALAAYYCHRLASRLA
jgi:hypothetical protein